MWAIMDPSIMPIFGFGAVVIIGGLAMAAVSFFSMKETTYESVVEKKKHELEINDQEKARISKQKREPHKKKMGPKKKKAAGQGDNIETNGGSKNKKTAHASDDKADAKNDGQRKAPTKNNVPQQAEEKPQPKSTKKNIATDKPQQALPNEAGDTVKAKKKEVPAVGSNKKAAKADDRKEIKAGDKKATKVDDKKPAKAEEKKAAKADDKKAPKLDDKKGAKVNDKKLIKTDNNKPAKVDDKKANKANDKKAAKTEEKKAAQKAVNVDASSKAKRKVSQSGESLADMIRSTPLDDAATFMLIDLLNEKSNQGQWLPADGSRKAQTVELQRQLEQKNAEITRFSEESHRNQLKAKKTIQELESLKQLYRKANDDLEKLKAESHNSKQVHFAQLEEERSKFQALQNKIQNDSETSDMKALKEENSLLRQTIQGNAATLADKQSELEVLRKSMDENLQLKKRCAEMESKLSDYQLQTKAQADKENAFSKSVEEMKLKIMTADARYGQLESEYQKVQSDLQMQENESAKLLEQVTLLNSNSEQQSLMEKQIADTTHELEQRLAELITNEQQQAEEVAKLHTTNKDLLKRLEEMEMHNQNLKEELQQERNSANKVSENMQKSSDILSKKDEEIFTLTSSVKEGQEEVKKLQSEIEKLKKKNNELRERNWKAMDAVAEVEKVSKEKLLANQNEGERTLKEMQSSIQDQLQGVFPSVSATKKEFSEWLKEFLHGAKTSSSQTQNTLQASENQIKELKQQSTQLSSKLKKQESSEAALQQSLDSALKRNKSLEEEVKVLQEESQSSAADVLKYKSILASTEEILQSLQSSVEQEEKAKGEQSDEKVTALTRQLEDKSRLLENLKADFDKLKAECNNKTEVSRSQVNQSSGKEDQGFVIVDDQPANAGTEQDNEVAKLKERLEKEKELTKNLAEAAKKLQTLLKQTQDELSKERKKNKEEVEAETN